MIFIGITGGVGAGKSEILRYLAKKPGVRVMLADEIAHALMEPGTACYRKLEELFAGQDVFLPEGGFDREKLAMVLFSSEEMLRRLNRIVHPAVKDYVRQQVLAERALGENELLVLEAALLIEEHYDELCDELWYIHASEEKRAARLMASRGYAQEKVRQIFDSQLSEQQFRRHCARVIDNNGTVEESIQQIEQLLKQVFINKRLENRR